MKFKSVYVLLFIFTMLTIVGCYTKLGYYQPTYLNEKQHKHVDVAKEDMEHASDSEVETDIDKSESYYGRRKLNNSSSYNVTRRSYWVPYASHPQFYYPPAYYYPHPWYYGYGYYPSYSRYYRSYYPYGGYYGRYYGRTYYPTYRGSTYNRGAVLKGNRAEYRRSRASRSITSSNPRSERLKRSSQNKN